jgi:hypothetical protein
MAALIDSEQQDDAVKQFRTLLSEDIILTNEDCLRFLRARKWNQEDAVKMATDWWTWYNAPLDSTGLITPRNILDNIEDENEHLYRRFCPHSNMLEDKQGRPIYWEMTGRISSMFSELNKHLTAEQLIIRHVRQQEIMIRRLKYSSQKYNRTIEKQVVVFNLVDMSYAVDTTAMSVFKETLRIDQNYYPERLGKFYMINAPWFFTMIWSLIKPWIDPDTASKFQILGSNYLDTLRELIDDSQIPLEYGGSCSYFTWEWPFPDSAGCSPEMLLQLK